ncbi:MAG: energy transducer TonB [Acidobacteriaceae bacterium]
MHTSSASHSWLRTLVVFSTLPAMGVLCGGAVVPAALSRVVRTPANSVSNLELRLISHTTLRRVLMSDNCEIAHDPEALATPNPLWDGPDPSPKVTVSFIVGREGGVESPLILESSAEGKGRNILDTLRRWRYRPAMCNGVAVESEAEVQFSSR